MLYGDVFIGKVVKAYNPEKGFKGEMELSGGEKIYLMVGYDGLTADFLKESVNKVIAVHGDLAFPERDSQVKIPILDVQGKINGGGFLCKRGRLTKDVELKYSGNGTQYVQFSLAVNRGYGENKKTYFVNCTMFGNGRDKNPAVSLAKNGSVGRELFVQGRLDTNQKDGTTYYNMLVTNYEYIGSSKKDNEADIDRWVDSSTDDVVPF